MADNILFNRLQQLAKEGAKKFHVRPFFLKHSQTKGPYYIIQLPADSSFQVTLPDGRKLIAHDSHISINHKVREQHGKSVWHHSFYLHLKESEKGGKPRQNPSPDAVVSVFYTADDTVEPTRHAAWQTAAGSLQFTDEQWHDFIAITATTSLPILRALRKEVNNQAADLLNQYHKRVRKAEETSTTCQHHESNRATYERMLTAAIESLEQYIPLIEDQYEYRYRQGELRILRSLLTQTKQANPEAPPEEDLPLIESAATAAPTVDSTSAIVMALSSPSISLDSEIEKLKRSFADFNADATDEVQVAALTPVTQALLDLFLFLEVEEKKYTVSPGALQRLRTLKEDIFKAGESLVERLLNQGAFSLVDQLSAFHGVLSKPSFWLLALEREQDELLAYLLKHRGRSQVKIDDPVILEGKRYTSPLQYCVEHKKVKGLTLLALHGASLLQKDDSGLPFVYTILSTKDHPLRAVFESIILDKMQTHQTVAFYAGLIATLETYLKSTSSEHEHLSIEAKALMRDQIKVYQMHLEGARQQEPCQLFDVLLKRGKERLNKDPEMKNTLKSLERNLDMLLKQYGSSKDR